MTVSYSLGSSSGSVSRNAFKLRLGESTARFAGSMRDLARPRFGASPRQCGVCSKAVSPGTLAKARDGSTAGGRDGPESTQSGLWLLAGTGQKRPVCPINKSVPFSFR